MNPFSPYPPNQYGEYFPSMSQLPPSASPFNQSNNPYAWQSRYQGIPSHPNSASFYNEHLNPRDQMYSNDEMVYLNRPTMHRSTLVGSPSFPNMSFKHALTTSVTLTSGQTVALQAQERERTYRSRYWDGWKWYRLTGWLKVLIYAFRWLIGLNIDTVKKVKLTNMIYLTGYILPT